MVDKLLQRYLWLIDTLKNRGEMTFVEIRDAWQMSSVNDTHSTLNDRTFRNHCSAILFNFGIEIACRRGRNRNGYYIVNPEELERNSLNRWLIENFSLSAILSEHRDLSDKILVEDIPSSKEYLSIILSSLRLEQVLSISYCNFVGKGFENKEFAPLCVKLFKRRWYMLAKSIEDGTLKILSLDRITFLSITNKTYSYPKDFSPKAFFYDYYGIIAFTDKQPMNIILRAYDELPGYLSSLPLHHSQKLLQVENNYTDFSLKLVPTFEFVQELLLHRDQLEVLAPTSLRNEVGYLIQKMNKRYTDA